MLVGDSCFLFSRFESEASAAPRVGLLKSCFEAMEQLLELGVMHY
jgi:hypothetical protein